MAEKESHNIEGRWHFLNDVTGIATVVTAHFFPKARIYQFGSKARKQLNMEREGKEAKIFHQRSDSDLWIELAEADCDSTKRFREIKEQIEFFWLRLCDIAVDYTVMVNDGNGRWPSQINPSPVEKDFVQKIFDECSQKKEMILLYDGQGNFSFPWRKEE